MNFQVLSVFVTAAVFVSACSGAGDSAEVILQPAPVATSSRLSELLSGQGTDGYAVADSPRTFHFPADHGPHPEYRNEWWYVTGNLDGASGERFGFELTLFRFSLVPGSQLVALAGDASAWRTNQVIIGHFAVTDVDGRDFRVAQRYSRASLGLAGASATPFRVWLEDWSIGEYSPGRPGTWRLAASDDGVTLSLILEPQTSPVLQGNGGLSQKSDESGNASYYYSVPRLKSEGTLQIDDRTYVVSGLSWLDREWGSSALAADQQGWDWFALQLSDGSDLMFYRLRNNDGSIDVNSAGSWSSAGARLLRIDNGDVTIDPLRFWESPSGARYPVAWRFRIDERELDLTITPVLDAQELLAAVHYWEGAVDVKGSLAGAAISGRGYVELTGYAAQQ